MENKTVIEYLIKNNISISFAESCTGGALASALTKVPGASNIFKGSFVTYSEEWKIKYLGVNENTIKEFGVVSKEVSKEMVKGLVQPSHANLLVSVTGNAGPGKGDETKDVGTIFYSIMYKGIIDTTELNLHSSREENINETVDSIFNKIAKILDIK